VDAESFDADVKAGLAWQAGVWDGMSRLYRDEIDPRFAPIVDGVVSRAALRPGEHVLDLGAGTGTVAAKAAVAVGATGSVLAIDPSAAMVALARRRAREPDTAPFRVELGAAETIPAERPERREEAKAAVRSAMWPTPEQPRRFRNTVQFIAGVRS
jgi:SAM-dependent methyltransferase